MPKYKDDRVPKRRRRGFERTSNLLTDRIRTAGQSRGFAVSRLLTHWADIVGEETARIAKPVNVSYGKGGLGATLTVLTTGAQAPMLQMQEPRLRERVNACYGYAAIARIRFTQTAPTGFAEGKAGFDMGQTRNATEPDSDAVARAEMSTKAVGNDELRTALTKLGSHVLARNAPSKHRTHEEDER